MQQFHFLIITILPQTPCHENDFPHFEQVLCTTDILILSFTATVALHPQYGHCKDCIDITNLLSKSNMQQIISTNIQYFINFIISYLKRMSIYRERFLYLYIKYIFCALKVVVINCKNLLNNIEDTKKGFCCYGHQA